MTKEVCLARQIMNLIILLTIWFAFRLMRNCLQDTTKAFAAMHATFSGVYDA